MVNFSNHYHIYELSIIVFELIVNDYCLSVHVYQIAVIVYELSVNVLELICRSFLLM